MTILFVCSGNMHRSAVAEAMLKARLATQSRDDVEVISAGTLGLDRESALAEAIELATENGLDLSRHRSRGLRLIDICRADLIITMESAHRDAVLALSPDARGRCRQMSEFAGSGGPITPGDDVPDAIGEPMDRFRHTWSVLEHCMDRFTAFLPPASQDEYISAIDENFRKRRGAAIALSGADWQIIDRWWSAAVPLWIILECMDEVFDRLDKRPSGDNIRGLSYFEPLIEERHRSVESGRTDTRKAPDHTRIPPSIHARECLEQASARASSSGRMWAAEILATAAEQTRALDDEEESVVLAKLGNLQEEISALFRRQMPGEETNHIQVACKEELEHYRNRMTPDAFATTLARLVDIKVRERYGIPDLMSE